MKAVIAEMGPNQGRKTTGSQPLPLPQPVDRAIAKLGQDLRLARLRRRLTQQSLAERVGASVNTIKRMEAGDARIPLHFLARTLHVFGEISRLADVLDTRQDPIGLSLANEQLPQRVRNRPAAGRSGRGAGTPPPQPSSASSNRTGLTETHSSTTASPRAVDGTFLPGVAL